MLIIILIIFLNRQPYSLVKLYDHDIIYDNIN